MLPTKLKIIPYTEHIDRSEGLNFLYSAKYCNHSRIEFVCGVNRMQITREEKPTMLSHLKWDKHLFVKFFFWNAGLNEWKRNFWNGVKGMRAFENLSRALSIDSWNSFAVLANIGCWTSTRFFEGLEKLLCEASFSGLIERIFQNDFQLWTKALFQNWFVKKCKSIDWNFQVVIPNELTRVSKQTLSFQL